MCKARDLNYITYGSYKFYPLSDVNGRNTGREIYNGTTKLAAEYITYRKVGDHATNMPATVWFGGGNTIKDSIKYKYDTCGNICEITQNGHLTARYTYDGLNRLIREDNKLLNKTKIFTYDNNGNIVERCEYAYTGKTGEELSALTCNHYSYDYSGDRLVSYNGESCVYDTAGNPKTYRGKTAVWQYGRYLASYNGTAFTYDGLGRRIQKGSITFTYDSDGRLLKQSNGLEFIYDNSAIVGVKYNNAQYFYRRDAQSNIIAILDSAGAVVASYVYDAWGNHAVLNADGTDCESGIGVLNPFRYRGYYYDTETDLYYLQTRYYDPANCRFISPDSIDNADPNTLHGLNLYAYCGNNPVMNVDPTGTSFWSCLGRFLGGMFLGLIGASISLRAIIPALFNPIAAMICEMGLTIGFYGAALIGSVYDSAIYSDMGLIGWNPFNTNADAVLPSQKMSFYKGVPVIRTNNNRSGTFGVMLLKYGASAETVKHEFGHIPQLMMMGIAKYGFMIGLPSWQEWSSRPYYERPWEITADVFGGVTGRNHSQADINRGYCYLAVSALFGAFGYFFLFGEY